MSKRAIIALLLYAIAITALMAGLLLYNVFQPPPLTTPPAYANQPQWYQWARVRLLLFPYSIVTMLLFMPVVYAFYLERKEDRFRDRKLATR